MGRADAPIAMAGHARSGRTLPSGFGVYRNHFDWAALRCGSGIWSVHTHLRSWNIGAGGWCIFGWKAYWVPSLRCAGAGPPALRSRQTPRPLDADAKRPGNPGAIIGRHVGSRAAVSRRERHARLKICAARRRNGECLGRPGRVDALDWSKRIAKLFHNRCLMSGPRGSVFVSCHRAYPPTPRGARGCWRCARRWSPA